MKKIRLYTVIAALMLAAVLFCSCNGSSSSRGYDYAPGYSEDYNYQETETVIKNAEVIAETLDYKTAIDTVKTLIKENGGNIRSSDVTESASYYSEGKVNRRAYYVIRVPSENFDTFIDALGDCLNVTRLNTSTANMSEEQSALIDDADNLRKSIENYKKMLEEIDRETDYDEWRTINDKIKEAEYEIEECETRMTKLRIVTEYSTVRLSVTEVADLTETEEIGYGQEIVNAIGGSLGVFLDFLKGLLIVVIYMLPISLVAGGIVFLIIFLVKRGNRRRAEEEKKRAAMQKPNFPQGPAGQYGQFYGQPNFPNNNINNNQNPDNKQ